MEKKYSFKKAVIINASGKYMNIILQLIVNAILSRILSPDDYGIVVVISVFSTFFLTLSDMGFSTAIIQCKDLSKKEINNIFSFTLFVAIILVGMFTILSIFISNFYKEPVFIKLGILLDASLFFNTFNMVPNGIMNREKKFGSIAFRTIVANIIAAIIAIYLAINGWRYYAIVMQTISSAFIIFVWNYLHVRPKLNFDGCIRSVKKVINYSGYQFAFNIVNYFSRNLDNLLTGKFFGNAELGYYNKAYTLMLYPINNLAGVITPVVHPLLSEFQDRKDYIYQKYIKLVKLLFICAAFIAPFCYLSSNEIIGILYGGQWKESIKCFELLSFAILPQFVGAPSGAIYQSLGKTKILFYNAILNTCITIFAILFGILVGKNIIALSACVAISYIIHFFTTNYMLIHIGFNKTLIDFLKFLFPEILIVVVVSVAIFGYRFSFSNIFISVTVKGIYLGIIYIAMLIVTKDYKLILNVIKRK